jgi:hypothetical protein
LACHEIGPQLEAPCSSQDAAGWYESAAYRPLRDLRQAAADTVTLLAEGVDGARGAGMLSR